MTVFKKYNEGTAEWEAIAVGLKGDKGDPGDPGGGLPTGGTAGQYIVKQSTTDFDTAWVTPTFVDAAGAVSAIKADADWNATDWDTAFSVTSGLGTISTQDANSVNIDGGAIDATDIGVTTPATVSSDNYLTADNYPTIKPSLNLDFANTKTLDPRVTFARASTATYYDGQTVAKAEENLQTNSEEFDNWSKEKVTATANDANAPDGNLTADTVAVTATSGEHYIYINSSNCIQGVVSTVSVYAKNVDQNYIQFGASNNGSIYANFDLSAGVVGTSSGVNSSSITNVGNGWYRCVATFTTTSSGFFFIGFVNSASASRLGSYTPASTTSVYLWGAQVEQRDSVTAYTPTTTQPITNYIPVLQTASSGDPRFDHDPITGESKGLLIEEQRTNLLTYSEDFSDASWFKPASIASNVIIAPNGALTGTKLIENSGTGSSNLVSHNNSSLGSNTACLSVFAKKAERNILRLAIHRPEDSSEWAAATFNLDTGTTNSVAFGGASLEEVYIQDVGNGFYRCTISGALTDTTARAYISIGTTMSIFSTDNRGRETYTGDGYSGIYIWGAQLEQGSFPTSYIKTEGSQVTRVADSASMTGTNFSDWYRQDEGTLFGEAFSTAGYVAQIDAGNNNNRISILSLNTQQAFVLADASVQAALDAGTISTSSVNKYALAYKVNDFALSLNNSAVATDTDGILPIVNRLNIGFRANSTDQNINGHIKKIAYYPQRLPNATLQALTEE